MFSMRFGRHGHRYGHGHGHHMKMHRSGETHEKYGHCFRYPGHHMGPDFLRRMLREHWRCCFMVPSIEGRECRLGKRHPRRHGKGCAENDISISPMQNTQKTKAPAETDDTNNPSASTHTGEDISGKRKDRCCRGRHFSPINDNEKEDTRNEEAKASESDGECMWRFRRHPGKRFRRHGRPCCSESSSSENETNAESKIRHGRMRRHHRARHGRRGHGDHCYEEQNCAHAESEHVEQESDPNAEKLARTCRRGRHQHHHHNGGKFYGHHHRGSKMRRRHMVLVDAAVNTEDTEDVPISLVECIDLDTLSENQDKSDQTNNDQVTEVTNNLNKSSLN